MDILEQKLAEWHSEMQANTRATLRVESNTADLVELMKLTKTGINFFAGTGRLLRKIVLWLGPFATLIAAIWAMLHGKWPGHS